MAQKQITWSAHAKKMLYSVLESLVRQNNNAEYAKDFFKFFSGRMRSLAKGSGSYIKTSHKDINAFFINDYLILFEDAGSEFLIHWFSKQ